MSRAEKTGKCMSAFSK